MPLKKRGPLQTLQKEIDDIKKRVDVLPQDVNGLDVEARIYTLQRCSDLQNTATETLKRLQKLTKADESAQIGNYEEHKRDEVERLQALQDRLRTLSLQLRPQDKDGDPSSDEAEEDSMGDEEEEGQEEEEDDAATDDDDDDHDDEEAVIGKAANVDAAARTMAPGSYVALGAFTGDEEGDLIIQKGDVLKVLQKNEDGWWLAQDAEGHRGLVPRNYLKAVSPDETEKQSEDEESDEEQEAGNEPSAVQPSTSSNWDSIRKAVAEMDSTDVLSAMGAIPPGFRASTLTNLLEEGVCRDMVYPPTSSTQHTGAAVSTISPLGLRRYWRAESRHI